jgi:hypothetical protein
VVPEILDLDPPLPTRTEVLEDEMAELEAATSSFVIDDTTELGTLTSNSVDIPFTRSRQALQRTVIACDPFMASYVADDNDIDPFADSYML